MFFGKKRRYTLHEVIETSETSIEDFLRALKETGNIEERNSRGLTPVHVAAFRGRTDFLDELLSNGASPNATNAIGYTPLMAAAMNLKVKSIISLLRAGAGVNETDQDGRSALICAAGCQPIDGILQSQCLMELLRGGANIDHKDGSGLTALMWSAWFGSVEAVTTLLEAGAKESILDAQGRKAKDLAVRNEHFEVAKLFSK